MNIADPSLCQWGPAPFLLFSENIWGNFIYYSHLLPAISILLIAGFIFWHNPRNKSSQALLMLALSFTSWSLIDLVLWASERSDIIMFFWSILIYFDLLIYVSAFYFIYTLCHDKWPTWKYELGIFALFVPLFLFSHTRLNLIAFDFTNCWREALEGPLWQYYLYNAELLITFGIVIFTAVNIKKITNPTKRKTLIFSTIGIIALLTSFSLGNILGSIETDWELGQYGLFGIPVFVVFLAYIIVKYHAFEAKVLATEALVMGLSILIFSLLLVRRVENIRVIAFFTLILTIALGFFLIKSVRKEVRQKEKIERLALDLEAANERLKELDKAKSEFVSIASHQLRSPLTAIRGYSSMLVEGSFGQLPQKAMEVAKRIEDSTKLMAMSIEDYLNVSRIESGNMKYNLSDFNLLELASKICDDLRPEALKQTLILLFRSDITSGGMVNADVGKVHQIIHNLINNSIKYTKKGSISVFMREDIKAKRIYIDISDTGIGMSQKTMDSLFQKFSRADNANSVNTSGTGLGLYVAVKMAEAMGGSITAHSEGDGKGSTFTFELPLSI